MSAAPELSVLLPRGHLALGRWVWTYLREGQPQALITGYEDEQGGIVVEQIVSWSANLPAFLSAGLEEAWARGFEHIILLIPERDPRAARLTRLADRMAFTEYAADAEARWFVRYRS